MCCAPDTSNSARALPTLSLFYVRPGLSRSSVSRTTAISFESSELALSLSIDFDGNRSDLETHGNSP